jgi:hypothetical protein
MVSLSIGVSSMWIIEEYETLLLVKVMSTVFCGGHHPAAPIQCTVHMCDLKSVAYKGICPHLEPLDQKNGGWGRVPTQISKLFSDMYRF